MTPLVKIVLGGAATAALAGLANFGMAQSFIDELTHASATAVAVSGVSDLSVKMSAQPLRRVAELSGPISDHAARERVLATVHSVPGNAGAYWVEDPIAPPANTPPAEPKASAATVKNCQDDVDGIVKGKTIEFASGTSVLTEHGVALVASLAETLKPCAGTAVEVSGHTDATGSPVLNQALSETRAKSVVDALIARGVPAARLSARGFGSSKPIVEGTNLAANAKNRRIDFRVMAAK